MKRHALDFESPASGVRRPGAAGTYENTIPTSHRTGGASEGPQAWSKAVDWARRW